MQAQSSRSGASEQDTPAHAPSSSDASDHGRDQAAGGIIDRICTCVVEGLMHCACSHHQAHPELVACIQDLQDQRSETGK